MADSRNSSHEDSIEISKSNNECSSKDKTTDVENKVISESTWWGSWIKTAKSTSLNVLEAVKRDLDEISTVVRTEVSNAGSIIGESLKLDEPESTANTVKKSISSFLGQVGEVLVPTMEDDDTEAVLITSDGSITLNGFQKHLAELQSNDATYLLAPDDKLIDNYQRWLEVIEQDQFTQNRLAKHLASSEILNEKYLKLVPDRISHMEFWKRYLFKRALLEDALAHAELAERRAKAEIQSTKTVSPKTAGEIIQTEQPKIIPCDDIENYVEEEQTEDFVKANDDVKWDLEIPEEEQLRLLEEYEAEIQEREKREKHRSSLGNDEINHSTNQKQNNSQKSNDRKSNVSKGKNVKKTESVDDGANLKISEKSKKQKNICKSAEHTKADIESTSDESWEKDFDLCDN